MILVSVYALEIKLIQTTRFQKFEIFLDLSMIFQLRKIYMTILKKIRWLFTLSKKSNKSITVIFTEIQKYLKHNLQKSLLKKCTGWARLRKSKESFVGLVHFRLSLCIFSFLKLKLWHHQIFFLRGIYFFCIFMKI